MSGDAEDPAVDVIIEAGAWGDDVVALAQTAATAAFAAAGLPGARLSAALLFTDDATMARLNGAFRGRAAATNVLSWPSVERCEPLTAAAFTDMAVPEMGRDDSEDAAALFLGDVAFGYETIAAEANLQGKTLEDHIRHLIIHGVLHLLGFDHENEEAAATMEAVEVSALARLNVADPYAPDREPPARATGAVAG